MAHEEIPNNSRNICLGIGVTHKPFFVLCFQTTSEYLQYLGCKLSDIFIRESDKVADEWQNEIRRRLMDNEGSGLKIFGVAKSFGHSVETFFHEIADLSVRRFCEILYHIKFF